MSLICRNCETKLTFSELPQTVRWNISKSSPSEQRFSTTQNTWVTLRMRQTNYGKTCTIVSETVTEFRGEIAHNLTVGTSTISKAEADKLPNPTLPIPGTDKYLIQLDVWHQLHCLNDLRKLLYPDRFDGLDKLRDKDGNIDMTDSEFRHWGMSFPHDTVFQKFGANYVSRSLCRRSPPINNVPRRRLPDLIPRQRTCKERCLSTSRNHTHMSRL